MPRFRRGRESSARDHLVRDLVRCLAYSRSKREVLMGLRQERDRSEVDPVFTLNEASSRIS